MGKHEPKVDAVAQLAASTPAAVQQLVGLDKVIKDAAQPPKQYHGIAVLGSHPATVMAAL